jgi:hypothetical protein
MLIKNKHFKEQIISIKMKKKVVAQALAYRNSSFFLEGYNNKAATLENRRINEFA